jgi:hypothetical protein
MGYFALVTDQAVLSLYNSGNFKPRIRLDNDCQLRSMRKTQDTYKKQIMKQINIDNKNKF